MGDQARVKPRVLITGGLGYLGGRLARCLDEEGGYALRLGIHRAKRKIYPWQAEVEFASLDILSDESVAEACRGVHNIIHLAALDHAQSQVNPELAIQVNSLGTVKLLAAAKKAGVRRFIYFSTAHVYGAPLQGTITEKTLCRPTHPYAITHKTAEDFVLAAADKGEIEAVVLRLSNAIGAPYDPEITQWSLIVNDLCRQAVIQRHLVLKSSGLQPRDFLPISDVGRAVLHMLQVPAETLGDGVFNLGSGIPMKIIDMAKLIAARTEALFGYSVSLTVGQDASSATPPEFSYDVSKIAQTGFHPTGKIADAVDETLRFCMGAFGRE